MRLRHAIVSSLARLLGVRDYNGAKTNGPVWGRNAATASGNVNTDLNNSRAMLRSRSRHAWQNHATARAVVEGDVALVISTGIDIEPDTGDARRDEALKGAWDRWARHASACGRMDLWDLQRQARRSERVAGEFLWVFVPVEDYAKSGIPLAILAIESDRLSPTPIGSIGAGNSFDNGVEFDKYGKPVFYHISDEIQEITTGSIPAPAPKKKPGETSGKKYPASEVIHGFDVQRPGQVRGEPGLAPVLNVLRQEYELVEAELTAAKVGAAHSVKITTTNGVLPGEQAGTEGSLPTYDFSPGSVNVLQPGENAEVMANPRPSQQISPFRQMLRGDISGATGIPQRYIDRDTSRANYSSMRADMLDTQRILTPQQQRFGRLVAESVYHRILPLLAVSVGVSIPAVGTIERILFERCKIMPDGWAYVDPQKDVAAAKAAVDSGLTTLQEEIQSRGRDPRQVERQLQAERLAKAMRDIETVQAVQQACDASGVPGLTWAHILTLSGAGTAPGAHLQASVQAPAASPELMKMIHG